MKKSQFVLSATLLGTVLSVIVGIVTFNETKFQLIAQMREDVRQLEDKLSAELARYSELPAVLASDPRLITLLADSAPKQQVVEINRLLVRWASRLEADTVYLLNTQGTTIAASNWQSQASFVGQNYAYRPYYQQAIKGGKGAYYALGTRSGKRGYYFSYPVRDSNQQDLLGVLVIKVDLSIIEQVWKYQTFDYLLTDPQGVIFYSSNPNWVYQTLTTLPTPQKQSIQRSRRYGDTPLIPLSQFQHPRQLADNTVISLGLDASARQPMLMTTHTISQADWQLYGLTPISTLYPYVFQAVILFITFYFLVAVIVLAWWQRLAAQRQLARLNQSLERKVARRTQSLQASNQQLRDTLHQYERTQQVLKQTQSELVQAAKMATLGEMSAGINHEINQPLAAMRTYTENSQRLMAKARYQDVEDNLAKTLGLIQMIHDIVARFKIFAKKSQTRTGTLDVVPLLHAAVSLTKSRWLRQGITVQLPSHSSPLYVVADAILLEQVLVNLLTNAIDAVSSTPDPCIRVDTQHDASSLELRVIDNGKGMDSDTLAQVFTPFFTTKETGLGLGLTISKRILESLHGQLIANTNPTGGTIMIIRLPVPTKESE
ncbi:MULTISPECIES: sensor histidine kinase [unclassified Salinivibrio]|uniref:sensor histidine kinase n=1 Tax=unclassified Salinivibrio TaxID=2636825 RepID=UPI0009858A19|nr:MULTISPECIES: ATP-binding protein [unclassified Salinivibrio]OOF14681.1 hypothetical protein BZG83_05335 [Salinivibrio sp. PR919]OOF14798.1 hypothetical protein BZG84_13600 [Salinivibrio sp. PR932]